MSKQRMSEERYALPDGWEWVSVRDVVIDAQPGFASGKKDVSAGIRHLRMNNIGADCRLNLDLVRTVPTRLAQPRHLLQVNDVLVCHTNSVKLVGKVALFDLKDGPYTFSNHLTRLRVKLDVIEPRWLWQILAALWRERYFENRCKQWVNQATIERDTLLAAPIPLPPLSEQRRIVEKMELLLAQSHTAHMALDRIPLLLKKFRQAVLAAAFRGELAERDPNDETASVFLERIRAERRSKWEEELRAKGKDPAKVKYVEPEPPDTRDLPELPEVWVWTTLPVLGHLARGKSKHRPRDEKRLYGGSYPFIQTGDIARASGTITSYSQTYSESGLAQSRLWPVGTMCITIAANIGDTAILGFDGCFPDSVVGFIANENGCDIHYIEYFMRTAKNNLAQFAPATAQKNINLSTLQKLAIPLPSLTEQRRIVAKVQALLSQAEAIERAVVHARRRVEKVDQAILARAFRGEL